MITKGYFVRYETFTNSDEVWDFLNKGIIYSVKYKELDFTVPEFSGFIERLDEYRQWCNECS